MMVPSSSHPKARDWVILGLIVAVAALVRVLAMDGAATLGDPVDGAPDALIAGIIAEASAALIGLPAGGAILSGVLAVPVLWVLAWQAGLALPVAHGLAAALALASPHVWASADPGGGTLGVLAVLLAGLLFLAGVRGRSVWPWVALGPVAFVALIASPSAALGIATLAGIWLALFIWSCIDDLEGRVGTLQPLVCFALAGLAAGGVAITL